MKWSFYFNKKGNEDMWKAFNKHKPKDKGWYITTVEVEGQQRYTMALYWYPDSEKFIDNIRDNVCQVYEVMGYGNGNEKTRLYNIGQDRTESVVAWKKISKPYMKGFIEHKIT